MSPKFIFFLIKTYPGHAWLLKKYSVEFWQPCLRPGAAEVRDVPVAGVRARHRLLAALPLAHAPVGFFRVARLVVWRAGRSCDRLATYRNTG